MVKEQKQMQKLYVNYLNKKYRKYFFIRLKVRRKLVRGFIIAKRLVIKKHFFIKKLDLVVS